MIDLIDLSGNLLLFALIFGMSATVDIKALIAQMKNRRAIMTGCFLQFIVMPLLGFMVVKALDLNETMGITLLVVTSSPGGSYSNWWCSMFNADLALSVTMTAISTILSIFMLPANLLLYSRYSYNDDVIAALDWTSLFTALGIVIGAILLGLFCSAKIHSHKFNAFANKIGNFAGIALVVFSATISNSGGGDNKIWERDWKFYVGIALPCLAGLAISNVMTTVFRLKKPERVTVSVECCYQNVGIATSVALTMFDKQEELAEAMGVPLFYGTCEAVILAIYCLIAWKFGWTKAPKDAPLCHVLGMSYEVYVVEKQGLESIEIQLADDSTLSCESYSENEDTIFTYFVKLEDAFNEAVEGLVEGQKEPSGLTELEEERLRAERGTDSN